MILILSVIHNSTGRCALTNAAVSRRLSVVRIYIMQLFDVCAKREFMKDGEKQTKWYKVGTMKSADSGKKYLRIYLLPQTEFFVFEKEVQEAPENLPVIN